MVRANCKICGATQTKSISKRVSEQLSRKNLSGMRTGTYSTVAAPRISRCARVMRGPPRGGRRMQCANR
eukprot:232094-Lingulodinium_polyedra.AAC.1